MLFVQLLAAIVRDADKNRLGKLEFGNSPVEIWQQTRHFTVYSLFV